MIPYNPSSFDTNKTILEQILELKNWLKEHPSYKVFYCTSTFMPTGDDDRAFSEIAGDTDEVATISVGDIIVFPDAYYGEVIAVDYDNEIATIGLPATSVKGPQGPAGTNGISVTTATINGSGHLILTLSDGTSIDAGMSKGADGTNGTNGTDGKYISNATVDGNGDLICTIYDPETSTSTQVNAGYVVGPAGQDGHGMSIINTTTSTGTLSASDLAKANGTDDCIVIFTDNGTDLTMQRILKDSSNVYFYAHFVDTSRAQFLLCEVDAVTGAYNINGGDLPIKASNIDSESATNGQVLTADGNGGASWQNASGGNLYQHFLNVFDGATMSGISFTFISTSNTKINSLATLANWLYTNNFKTTNAWWGDCLTVYGAVRIGGTTYRGIIALSSTNGTGINYAWFWNDSAGWSSLTYATCFTGSATYVDNVIQIM